MDKVKGIAFTVALGAGAVIPALSLTPMTSNEIAGVAQSGGATSSYQPVGGGVTHPGYLVTVPGTAYSGNTSFSGVNLPNYYAVSSGYILPQPANGSVFQNIYSVSTQYLGNGIGNYGPKSNSAITFIVQDTEGGFHVLWTAKGDAGNHNANGTYTYFSNGANANPWFNGTSNGTPIGPLNKAAIVFGGFPQQNASNPQQLSTILRFFEIKYNTTTQQDPLWTYNTSSADPDFNFNVGS